MLIKNKKWKNHLRLSLGLFAAVVLFELIPGFGEIISLGYDMYSRGVESEEAKKNTVLETDLKTEIKKLKLLINNIISDYDENQKISSIISFIDEAAYGKRVKIVSIKPGKIVKKDNLWLQLMEVNIDSDYEGLFNFTREVEGSSKVIIIKEIAFTSRNPLSDSLRIKANMEVYLNL